MITRSMVQSFLDGLKVSGFSGNSEEAVQAWLKTHPTYPAGEEEVRKVLKDFGSYR